MVMSNMRLNSIKQITPDLVFEGILNAMPSGLLFPQCLLRAMIKDLWKFLSQLFPHCKKAFFSINTDKAPLRGG